MRSTKGPPPEDLELLLALVNAVDFGAGSGELASPRALSGWLTERGLGSQDEEVAAAGHDRAKTACAGLRALVATGHGAGGDADALEGLNHLTAMASIRAHFAADGTTRLEPTSDGLDGVVERVFAIVARARLENLWPRFKICADETCRRVFYDESRNLGARWCSLRCGNRRDVRYFRQRKKR